MLVNKRHKNQLKGVILAGGTGSRLYPLTKVTNKHLLPVGSYPMLYHGIHKLCEIGIRDIMVVTGKEHMGDVVGLLGSGKQFSCELTYRVQDEAGGIAQALYLTKSFVAEQRFVVILGDNMFESSLDKTIEQFLAQKEGCRLLLKQVSDPHRFGVATLKNHQVVHVVEKPKNPESDLIVTGIYCYDSNVFDYIEQCQPSKRGELEITDVNNAYIQDQHCFYDILQGWWTDAGTFPSYRFANQIAEKVMIPLEGSYFGYFDPHEFQQQS